MTHRNFFAPSMVENGYADAMISGLTLSYPETIRPAIAHHREKGKYQPDFSQCISCLPRKALSFLPILQ